MLFALSVVLLSSCVTARKVNYMQKPDRYIPTYADTLSFEDYTLRTGDRLYVYVYSLDEKVMQMYNSTGLNTALMRQQMSSGGAYDLYTYLVDDEGNITFPTIGKLNVQGKTTREVKRMLEEQLSQLLQEIPGYSPLIVCI